ncbi:CDCA4 protein, partial [Polyodon spathula]|nr:SERTA domain-containing protein 3 [Polyodon spathula]XP_041092441.1 SERTA domain-containing protein 3 [Polyodon spathula]MBN3287722.1 CDCA4 protein [Polyodon spathula]
MTGKGLKRKLPEEGDLPEGSAVQKGSGLYCTQRQSVLNISLDKYNRGQKLLEPSLRRSVLIANTLRQIQEEIRQEVSHPGTPQIGSPPAAQISPLSESNSLKESLPAPAPPSRLSMENHPMGLGDSDDWTLLSSEEDFSLSSAISSLLKELDVAIDGSPAPSPQRTPLGSIENLETEKADKQEPCKAEGKHGGCRPSETAFGNLEIMSSSYLRDVALDDLFLDIDTSVYERDAGPLGGRTLSSAASDEFLKYLPSCHPSSFSMNPNARDLNELEHIMEILVGS